MKKSLLGHYLFRRLYLHYLLLGVIVLSALSCRKEEPELSPKTTEITVKAAKIWFEQNISNSSDGKQLRKGRKEPIWEMAQIGIVEEGQTVEVPLRYERGKSPGKGTLSKLIIFKNNLGKLEAQVMIVLGDKRYLEKNGYRFNNSDFTGIIRIEDWQENFVKGFWYTDGKQKGIVEDAAAMEKSGKSGRSQNFAFSYFSYWYYRTCSSYGCSSWTVGGVDTYYTYISNYTNLYTYYNFSKTSQEVPYDPGYDPIEETATETYPNPRAELKLIDQTEVRNLCMKTIIRLFGQDNAKFNDVTLILDNVFNWDEKVNLKFKEVTTLPIGTDGSTSGSKSGEYVNIEISLNGNVLPHSSQEYIAATVAHEIIHGYLRVTNKLANLDHETMATNYVDIMRQALQDIQVNIPREQAEALAWGGLQETLAWRNRAAANPTWAQNVQKINSAHRDIRMYNPYKGTRCY